MALAEASGKGGFLSAGAFQETADAIGLTTSTLQGLNLELQKFTSKQQFADEIRLITTVMKSFEKAGDTASEEYDELTKALALTTTAAAEFDKELEERLLRFLENTNTEAKKAGTSINDLRMDIKNLQDEQGKLLEGSDALLENRRLLQIAEDRLTIALGGETAAMKEQRKAAEDLAREMKKLADVVSDALGDAFEETGRRAKKTFDDITDAVDKATSNATDAVKSEAEEQEDLQEKLKEATIQGVFDSTQFAITIGEIRIQRLREQLAQGIISEQEFAQQTADIAQRQAVFAKTQAIFGVILNTATAISKTAANLGFPLAIPFIAAAAALGAANLALIIAQPVPEVPFAEGEIDIQRRGAKRGKDSIAAKIMPGESVIPTDKTRENKPLLQHLLAGTLDDYIYKAYINPHVIAQVSGFDSKQTPGYNDYRLRLEVGKKQPRSLDKDTIRALGREIAGNMRKRYR